MDLKIESVNRRHGRLAFKLGRESWRPLDVALAGPGYLAVQAGDGEAYTRRGDLQVDANVQGQPHGK